MKTYSEWHLSDRTRRIEIYYQAVDLLIWERKLEKDTIYVVFDDFDDDGKWIYLDKFYKTKDGFLAGYRKASSDDNWPNKSINTFADYFDTKPFYYKTVKRPHVVKEFSDLIIDIAIRLDEYYGIGYNAIEILQAYDIVPTKYGPAFLTSYSNEEIKYATKALYFIMHEKSVSISNFFVQSKCLEKFKKLDDEPLYNDAIYSDQLK